MNSGPGIRVDRFATGGPQQQARAQEIQNNRLSTTAPVLRRAVVVDIFYDLELLTDDVRARLAVSITNPDLIPHIKRNCILARELTADTDRSNSKPIILFPLLDPYLCLPLKPGETVLVILEDAAISVEIPGYWLCRVPNFLLADDVNFTHDDRRHTPSETSQDLFDKLEMPLEPIIGFPNGADDDDSLTIGQPDEYEKIVKGAAATKQFQYEPVPRYSKRPGDHVIQGSNNTLIVLGTERKDKVTNVDDVATGVGLIDIVVGRGQGAPTAPKTIKNTREFLETDKQPHVGMPPVPPNHREGDPDYTNDSARIYASMKTNIDEKFDINPPNAGGQSGGDKSAIAFRADHARLLGRDDVKIQAGTNEEGAAIILRANGDIILVPGPLGVIKIGGNDASEAVICNPGASVAGQVQGQPIVSSMGGVVGTPLPDPHGFFANKILVTKTGL